MKNLTILRHGKSIRSEEYPIDFDRPLAKHGRKDLVLVANLMKRLEPPIDWIISSPARHARQSSDVIAEELKFSAPIIIESALYESGVEAALPLIEQIPAEVEHVLIVGHNPTLEQLISGLCAGSVSRMGCSLPTAGVANMQLQIMWWEQVRWGSGQLRLYLRPRLLLDT